MQRLLIEHDMNEETERQLYALSKKDVVDYKATTENKYIGDWCGCYDFMEFGFDCVHLEYLKRNNLKTWKDVNLDE